jgi:hypothetical protein
MDIAKGFGAAGPVVGLLAWLFWQERTERRDLQKDNVSLFREKLKSDSDMLGVLEKIADKVGA